MGLVYTGLVRENAGDWKVKRRVGGKMRSL